MVYSSQPYRILWTANDNENILYADIFLSTDSGLSWKMLIAGAVRSNEYWWTPPMMCNAACRLKIVGYDPSWNQNIDISDYDFSVTDSLPPPTSTPSPSPTRPPETPSTPTPVVPTTTPEPTPPVSASVHIPGTDIGPGDNFYVHASLINHSTYIDLAYVFVIFEINGNYWSAPSWPQYPAFDRYALSLSTGPTLIEVISPMTFPSITAVVRDVGIWSFVTTPGTHQLLSNIDIQFVDFGT